MVHIPNDLWDFIEKNPYDDSKEKAAEAERLAKQPRAGEWMEYAKYEGSNGTSIHTVSIFVNIATVPPTIDWKCTCQAFRIQKRECKHILRAQSEYEIL